MDIHKDRIIEVYNNAGNKVIIYKQKIINNTLHAVAEIETEDLNSLVKEVRKKLNEWNSIGGL